jgi:hypothetical protein
MEKLKKVENHEKCGKKVKRGEKILKCEKR